MAPSSRYPSLALSALFTASLVNAVANTTVTDRLPRTCDAAIAGPLVFREADRICNVPVDKRAEGSITSWAPWTHEPACAPSTHQKATDHMYCAFTKDDFRGEHGLIVLTDTLFAADGVRLLEDTNPQWSRAPPLQKLTEYPPCEMKAIESKGLGLVANQTITKGSVIMRESPVIMRLKDRPKSLNRKEGIKVMQSAFANLDETEQLEILDLATSLGGHRLDDIMRTNSFQVNFHGLTHQAVFKEISRMNHACRPNAVTRWSANRVQMEVLAYEDIKPGDEINISYAPINMRSEERRDHIVSNWGFECKCPICASETEAQLSDSYRRQIDRILEELGLREIRTPLLVKELIDEVEDILDIEGLDALRGDLYGVFANIYNEMGDKKGALRYAETGLGLQEHYKGWDDGRTTQARRFIRYMKHKLGRKP